MPAAARRPSQSPAVTALPEGEPSWVLFVRGCVLFWCIRFGRFRRSSSAPASPGHLPPGGRFFGLQLPRTELGNCRGYSRGRRGRAPALRKVRSPSRNYCAVTNRVTPKGVGLPPGLQARNRRRHTQQNVRPPPCNEPGDPQRWWFTTRASGSNCQRPLAAAYSLPVQQ